MIGARTGVRFVFGSEAIISSNELRVCVVRFVTVARLFVDVVDCSFSYSKIFKRIEWLSQSDEVSAHFYIPCLSHSANRWANSLFEVREDSFLKSRKLSNKKTLTDRNDRFPHIHQDRWRTFSLLRRCPMLQTNSVLVLLYSWPSQSINVHI